METRPSFASGTQQCGSHFVVLYRLLWGRARDVGGARRSHAPFRSCRGRGGASRRLYRLSCWRAKARDTLGQRLLECANPALGVVSCARRC